MSSPRPTVPYRGLGRPSRLESYTLAFYNCDDDTSTFSFWLGPHPKDAFNVFATGYRRAAERLARSLLRRRRFSDYEAYPIVFLYRHALELSLKHAIYKTAEFAGYAGSQEIDDRLYNTHRLDLLAATLKRSLTLLFPDDIFLHRLLSRIAATSHELADIDAASFTYRYPIDSTGQPSAQAAQLVNLRAFVRHMSSLLEDIDTLNFGLNNTTDLAQDAFMECLLSDL